jgi:hypothetical protein
LAIAWLITGCAAAPKAKIVTTEGAAETHDEIAFWTHIEDFPIVSSADALHAMSIYAGGAGGDADYARRVASLKARDLLPADYALAPDAAINRGTLARFVAVWLKLPRGVNASLFGWNARYAIRELEFRGLLPPSSPNQLVSGAELIGVLSRADDYRRDGQQIRDVTQASETPPVAISEPNAESVKAGRPMQGSQLASLSLNALSLLQDVPPATAPADAAAPITGKGFVFAEVVGGVAVQRPEADAPIAAEKGMAVEAGSEIITPRGGMARLTGAGGQTIALDANTRATLRQAEEPGGVLVTIVSMRRGRAGTAVERPLEASGQYIKVNIESPRSTLAIKGTRVALYDQQPYDVEARSFTGTASFEQFQRQRVSFGRKNGGLVTVTGQTPDPTGVALAAATSDPGARAARTESEARLISNYFSRSALVRFDRISNLPAVFGGPSPTPAAVRTFFRGDLNFAISWKTGTNVNIAVLRPNDEVRNTAGGVVYPLGSLARGPNFDLPFDHRGGANGGFEVVNFTAPRNGSYTLFVQNFGRIPAAVTLSAFLNGQPLSLTNIIGGRPQTTPTRSIQPKKEVIFKVTLPESTPGEAAASPTNNVEPQAKSVKAQKADKPAVRTKDAAKPGAQRKPPAAGPVSRKAKR